MTKPEMTALEQLRELVNLVDERSRAEIRLVRTNHRLWQLLEQTGETIEPKGNFYAAVSV